MSDEEWAQPGLAVEPTAIRQVSEDNDFPSRAPSRSAGKAPALQRRQRPGRNTQFNIKTTSEVIARLTAMADRHDLVFGELLKQAIEAFEERRRLGCRSV